LRCLTDGGAAVAILHHPRRRRSDEGCTARGHGGLLAAVDVIVELSGFGKLRTDERRRKLFAVSRYPETPNRLVYEWDAAGRFHFLGDPSAARFRENWAVLHAILARRRQAATHQDLLMDWAADQEKPSAALLYEWLNRAFAEQRVRRLGHGRKGDPFRYRLENEADAYLDRGLVPPLGPLDVRAMFDK
jgi:hypothetical protein